MPINVNGGLGVRYEKNQLILVHLLVLCVDMRMIQQ